jgi:hypothetical protein
MKLQLGLAHIAWIALPLGIGVCMVACSSEPSSTNSSSSSSSSSGEGGGGNGGSASTSSSSSGGGSGGGSSSSSGGGSGGSSSSSSGSGGGSSANPHPLYPPLDLDTLPGNKGGAVGPYEPPVLPTTNSTVMISTTGQQAKTDILAACNTPGTAVIVPDAAGRVGILDFGNVNDCDITLGPAVIADLVYIGHLPGPQVAPSHRIRIRGGQIGHIMVDPGSSDIVFDGVILNNAVVPPAQRTGLAIYLINNGAEIVNRFAFVNSILRMVATLPDGNGNMDGGAYIGAAARNVFFANNNMVTAGNRNSWGFRIGGGDNFIIVDNTIRVSFHKLIRMNDGPVDYVYVKNGIWMRENTLTAQGMNLNDSFAQLGDLGTDNVYIHDPTVYLLSPAAPVSFGASFGPGQMGKSWEARNIAWHALAANVVSDTVLMNYASNCPAGATCDYGIGTHSYQYDANLAFPANPWRDLPTIATDDPDDQPIAP